jgi:uncharacterized membrane protein YsdA (DUF1294 family)
VPETPIHPSEPPGSAATPLTGRAVVRHAPRYRAFALVGVVVGLLAGALVAVLLGTSGGVGPVALVALGGGLLGGWLGALVAVLVDRHPTIDR